MINDSATLQGDGQDDIGEEAASPEVDVIPDANRCVLSLMSVSFVSHTAM